MSRKRKTHPELGVQSPAPARSFAEHMEASEGQPPIKPIEKKEREPAPPSASQKSLSEKGRSSTTRHEALRFPNPDDPLLARRDSVRRGLMRDLMNGRIRPEHDVDLHGLTLKEAEKEIRQAVQEASRQSARCLLVISGRGRRSPGGQPILRTQIPHWLSQPPLQQYVSAFAPATPQDGGRGALYVLLHSAPVDPA